MKHSKRTLLMCEVVYDITTNAQFMIDNKEIVIPDSRALFNRIYAWAEEFEETYKTYDFDDDGNLDYIEAIDAFAIRKLSEEAGLIPGKDDAQ